MARRAIVLAIFRHPRRSLLDYAQSLVLVELGFNLLTPIHGHGSCRLHSDGCSVGIRVVFYRVSGHECQWLVRAFILCRRRDCFDKPFFHFRYIFRDRSQREFPRADLWVVVNGAATRDKNRCRLRLYFGGSSGADNGKVMALRIFQRKQWSRQR